MKKYIFMILGLSIILSAQSPDWRREVCGRLQKVADYEDIAAYLDKNLSAIPASERAEALVILCYAYKEMGQMVNEHKWLHRFFNDYGRDQIKPDFKYFPSAEAVKFFDYLSFWQRTYPKVNQIILTEEGALLSYFQLPSSLNLEIEAMSPTNVILEKGVQQNVFQGYLSPGKNTIPIPLTGEFKRAGTIPFKMILKTNTIETFLDFEISTEINIPREASIDVDTNQVDIKGENFRPEVTENILTRSSANFDKKYFFRHSLIPLLTGILFLSGNRLLISPQLSSSDGSPRQHAFYQGIHATTIVLSVGFLLKGLVEFPVSWKKKQEQLVRKEPDPVAIEYNQELHKRIEAIKKNIFVTYRLMSKNQ